jgi:DNA-binding SARP family transcriptional activator
VLGSPASPAPALLAIQAFGEAHLRVLGELVPMRKATKDLELILFLAHQAAAAQAQDKKIPYTYRSTLADALWPVHSDEGEGLALQSLKQAKFTLSKRLLARTPALVEAAWLESGQGRAALRLAPTVTTDLVEFLRLTRRLAHATHQASGSAPQAAEVEAWLSCLEQCYQGGFALQFREEEWVQGARARYRQQYLDARFDVARLYARLGRHGQAILLAKELLLEENVSADTILPPLLTWLEQEGGKGAVAHWQDEYRRRYQYKFQRSLAEDRPDQEALFRRFLNPAGR